MDKENVVHIHNVIKKNGSGGKLMELEIIILSEIS
jgi:hypothetical protein